MKLLCRVVIEKDEDSVCHILLQCGIIHVHQGYMNAYICRINVYNIFPTHEFGLTFCVGAGDLNLRPLKNRRLRTSLRKMATTCFYARLSYLLDVWYVNSRKLVRTSRDE